ncbi:hypothetical protein HAX54_027958 [Datura stramonium]|uniref:cellulase n=1 Tax=Datura stramonium TaxID=4076 RepID=A0ABS8V3K9_DATST|nr:hypothetical protein [Datura stramonium]
MVFWPNNLDLGIELFWGAAWLLRATNDISYLKFINTLGANDVPDLFSWDNKYAGCACSMARRSLVGNDNRFDSFRQHAKDFVCVNTTQLTLYKHPIYKRRPNLQAT